MSTNLLTQLETILKDNWNSGTVDEPVIMDIVKSGKERVIDLHQGDYILLYEVSNIEQLADLGGGRRKRTTAISLDIRTSDNRTRALDLYEESRRILMANRNFPFAGTNFIRPVGRKDLSNRRKGIWRYVYDIELLTLCESNV